MSYTQLIKDTLDILDLNIIFEKNCLTKEKYKGAICMIYRGKLSYAPRSCTHCTEKNTMIRWGKTTVRLLVNDVSEYKTYLDLEKQRFRCKHCGKTVVADTSVVDKHCFISRKVRWSVVERLQKNTSMTEIAHQKKISTSSVYRILKKFYQPMNPFKTRLPKILLFDEFKSVRNASGAMSFIMMDGETNQLFDILENRQLSYLKKYFYRFSKSQRDQVTHIVIDMYSPYMSLVHKLFPKAKLLIDRFHIVQHIGRTFRNHRISWTNLFLKDPQDRSKGKQLKRYWKLLQKNQDKLNYQKPIWRPSFKKHLTETEIVDRLLSYSDELKIGYDIYQGFLYRVKKRDVLGFSELLSLDYTALPNQYQTTINTFKKYHKQIKNALRYPYSNGPLECLNNHIKVLKRNAYDFRDFYNFKLRIFLCQGKALVRI